MASYQASKHTVLSFLKPSTPPAPIFIVTDLDRDGRIELSGLALPGSTVRFTLPDGQALTARAGILGLFSIETTSVAVNGAVSGVVVGQNGQASPVSTVSYVDRVAPAKPTLTAADPDRDGRVDVSGRTEAGATVRITLPDGEVVQATAGADGRFAAESVRVQGSGKVTAVATDLNGNVSAAAAAGFTATPVQPEPGQAPQLQLGDPDADGRLDVGGQTSPGASVRITMPDGQVVVTTADADGRFSAESAAPQTSGNVSAVATAPNGLDSAVASVQWVDTVAPLAPTLTVGDIDGDGRIDVSGQAEAGATVRVTMPDGSVLVVTTDAAGLFVAESAAAQSSGAVSVIATDPAGNASSSTSSHYTAATTAPAAPVFTVTDSDGNGRPEVNGTTSAGAIVTATFASGRSVEGVADAAGLFSLEADTVEPAGAVSVLATSADGSPSSAVSTGTYVDATPPQPATAEVSRAAGSGLLTVSGQAEIGATVRVTFANGEVVTTVASPPPPAAGAAGGPAMMALAGGDDSTGIYTVTSATSQPLGEIAVEVTDINGIAGVGSSVSYGPALSIEIQQAYFTVQGSEMVGLHIRCTSSWGEAGGVPDVIAMSTRNFGLGTRLDSQWNSDGYWDIFITAPAHWNSLPMPGSPEYGQLPVQFFYRAPEGDDRLYSLPPYIVYENAEAWLPPFPPEFLPGGQGFPDSISGLAASFAMPDQTDAIVGLDDPGSGPTATTPAASIDAHAFSVSLMPLLQTADDLA